MSAGNNWRDVCPVGDCVNDLPCKVHSVTTVEVNNTSPGTVFACMYCGDSADVNPTLANHIGDPEDCRGDYVCDDLAACNKRCESDVAGRARKLLLTVGQGPSTPAAGEQAPQPAPAPTEAALYRPDVVAGKYDRDLMDPDGRKLLVNELFYSIQGEGMHAGRAAVFIRMAKCNLACKFCDTEFETYKVVGPGKLAASAAALTQGAAPLIVLTGGEPLLQNLEPLIHYLRESIPGCEIAIETSGSVWAPWLGRVGPVHVCISPKVPKSRIPAELLDMASEFKWVVNAAFLMQWERNRYDLQHPTVPNYLQPESQNPKWTAAAVKILQRYPNTYRLSIQTHKYLNLP